MGDQSKTSTDASDGQASLPGVFVNTKSSDQVASKSNIAHLNALQTIIGDIDGEPLGHFNTYMTVGTEVAKYFGLDAHKRMVDFYAEHAGTPIVLRRIITFWMAVFGE